MTSGRSMKAMIRIGPPHWGQTSGSPSWTYLMQWAHRAWLEKAASRRADGSPPVGPALVREAIQQAIGSILVEVGGTLTLESKPKGRSGAREPLLHHGAGGRTHNGANHPIRHRQAMESDRHWLGCQGGELSKPSGLILVASGGLL
jgi:hypothetical protein